MGHMEERAGLAGRAAIIYGGGGGLGRAIALDLARAGVDLALVDRDETLLAETVDAVTSAGARVVWSAFDVREADRVEAFDQGVNESYGRLDVLVNVVGGTFRQDFADSNERGWEALTRTNFTWLLRPTSLAIARMRDGGRGGSIINLTSIEAHRASPGFAVYGAMKAALTHLTRTLAVELAADGIRVNTIAPDRVPTERMMARSDEDRRETAWGDDAGSRLATQIGIPMQRRGTYEDIGNCAMFLASDLSSYITGMSFHPDGGVLASSGWWNWPDAGFRNFPPPTVTDPLLSTIRGTTDDG